MSLPAMRQGRDLVRPRDAAVGVLTVDDDPGFLQVAREIVHATPGFETVGEAATGEAAVSLVRALSPQLVLMDIRMPGIGGIEAARVISEAAGDRITVVLMSADPHLLMCGSTALATVRIVSKDRLSPAALQALWAD
jgi:two-component system, NarL family, invasion response regulator UvrY